ncbi:hypothetical protein M8818_001167 [Zalaria obscura]|uniref:Uncharacterized protein n=1 Tax=Zalaria obscura TaxID=2024903 RepID=A0ACC3SPQ3_9PEZI
MAEPSRHTAHTHLLQLINRAWPVKTSSKSDRNPRQVSPSDYQACLQAGLTFLDRNDLPLLCRVQTLYTLAFVTKETPVSYIFMSRGRAKWRELAPWEMPNGMAPDIRKVESAWKRDAPMRAIEAVIARQDERQRAVEEAMLTELLSGETGRCSMAHTMSDTVEDPETGQQKMTG